MEVGAKVGAEVVPGVQPERLKIATMNNTKRIAGVLFGVFI
jgi:hypothetical protein